MQVGTCGSPSHTHTVCHFNHAHYLGQTDRFPEIAKEAFRLGFGACVQRIADALLTAEEPLEAELALEVGRRFVELALHLLYFHAFFR